MTQPLDLTLLPPKLAARIDATVFLLAMCRAQLRGKHSGRAFAFSEYLMELEEKLNALQAEAAPLLTDKHGVSAAAGEGK